MSGSGDPLPPVQLARRFDRLCDRFEAALKAGRRPRVERYLGKLPLSMQPELLRELLVLELEYRWQNGEKPDLHEYRLRFAQHAELIDSVFHEARQDSPSTPYLLPKWTVSRLVSQIRALVHPEKNGEVPKPEVFSVLARLLRLTAA